MIVDNIDRKIINGIRKKNVGNKQKKVHPKLDSPWYLFSVWANSSPIDEVSYFIPNSLLPSLIVNCLFFYPNLINFRN